MKAEFHPAASEEVVETAAYYDGEVPGLGAGFNKVRPSHIEFGK